MPSINGWFLIKPRVDSIGLEVVAASLALAQINGFCGSIDHITTDHFNLSSVASL